MDDVNTGGEKAAKRRAILNAAVEIFARKGFANSRTREIARAAGVAEGTIYLYFEGKDDLLLTAFREKVTEFCAAADGLLSESSASFEERFRRFVELQFAGIEADPNLAIILLLESRQSTKFYGEPVLEVLREYAGAVDRLLESGVADRAVRPDVDLPLARRMLIDALEQTEVDWLLGSRALPLTPLAPTLAGTFLRGIIAPPT